MQKCFTELVSAGFSCRSGRIHIHTAEKRKSIEKHSLHQHFLHGKVYNSFGFEPLHNLRLGIPQLLKEYMFKFPRSDREMAKIGNFERRRQPLSQIRVSILRIVNSLLAAINREPSISGLNVDFSTKGCSVHLYGIFQNRDLR